MPALHVVADASVAAEVEAIGQALDLATDRKNQAAEVFRDRSDEWQTVIMRAVDAGWSNRSVARRVGVSEPRICAIIARQAAVPA